MKLRSPIREPATAVAPTTTTVAPANPIATIAPAVAAVAEFSTALAVTPFAAALASIAPLIAVAVFPFSFGNQSLILFGIFKEAFPVAIASRINAGLNGVVGLVWSIEDRRGFSALAKNSTGGESILEGNQGTFHGFWLACFRWKSELTEQISSVIQTFPRLC